MQAQMLGRPGRFFVALAAWLLVAPVSHALPIVDSYLNPNWTDADKLNSSGNWGINFWDDQNNNDLWESSEPLADLPDASWTHPKSADDLSCWMGSAANMLASVGFAAGDAQSIYWDMVNNMTTPWHPSLFGWQTPGWQHEALNWYLANRPNPTGKNFSVDYYGFYNARDGSNAEAWPADPFGLAGDGLVHSDQIGIVLHGATIWHAVTMQGYDTGIDVMHITDTDRDLHEMGFGLDPYLYDLNGPTHWELTDYLDTSVPIDYFAVLVIPEPGSLALLGLGMALLPMARRQQAGPLH